MRLTLRLSIVLVLLATTAFAQPRWSPEVRAKREMQWLKDSLNINQAQLQKISPLSLKYQQESDKVSEQKDKNKQLLKLHHQKDKEMKAILSKEQFAKYYKREELIRRREAVVYKGRQPY